jgi:hypothetical protein
LATVDGLLESNFFHAAAILIDPRRARKRNEARICTAMWHLRDFRSKLAKNSRRSTGRPHDIRNSSTAFPHAVEFSFAQMTFLRVSRVIRVLFVAAMLTGGAARAAAETAPVFRVFLKDGTALACWGEYAQVGDQLVLTLPVGSGARRAYEFLSLPVSSIDMPRTERYAEAVRAAQFAATRGAAEYAELRDRLAKQLAAIPLLPDNGERIAAAESARQQLLDWANTSHGYRAREVHELLKTFEATIIDLRVAAGESRFVLNLTAGVVPPAPPRLRAAPGAAETVALALRAASATGDEEVRKAILKRARSVAASLPGESGTALRAAVADRFRLEARLDSLYRWLRTDVTRRAERFVDDGDTRGVDALRQRVAATDRRWGKRRPAQVTGLLAALDAYYEAAAEHRLVLDQWESTRVELAAYQKQMAPLVAQLDKLRPLLAAITDLAGTPLTDLVRAEEQTGSMVTTLGRVAPPSAAAPVHDLLARAIERADAAVRTRHTAVTTRDLAVAREAAAAAREARARLTEAKAALAAVVRPPKASR